MVKPQKISSSAQVEKYFRDLEHPLIEVVAALRRIILAAHPEISEQIKWNSPSFYFNGVMKPFDPKEYKRDIVVFNLRRKDMILLVFPTGARVNDITGLLEGNYKDCRKIAVFSSISQVNVREKDIQSVVLNWINGVDQ
jgi:hypothetical protein